MLESFAHWTWFQRSLAAMLVMIPLMMLIPYFQRNHGLSVESFFLSWFIGCGIGFLILGWEAPSLDARELFAPIVPFAVVFAIAIVFGAPANILLVQAVPQAPNPALPFAIVNAAAALAYGLSWAAGRLLPNLFDAVEFSWLKAFGILFIVGGIALVNYKPVGS